MFKNNEKLEILQRVIEVLEESTGFSFVEFMKGEGWEEKDIRRYLVMLSENRESSFDMILHVIRSFEENSDQSVREFLLGEGYSSEEISFLLEE